MSASRKKKERKLLEAEKTTVGNVKKVKEKKTGVDRALRDVLIIVGIIVLATIIVISCVSCRNYNKKHAVIATIGDNEVRTPMMNYAYMDAINSFYSQYSSYISLFLDPSKPLDEQECSMDTESENWAEFFVRMAGDNLEHYYNICDYAKESGYQLTADDKAQISSNVSSVEEYAKSLGRSADSYLESIYGFGCNLDNYEDYITLQVTASGCYNAYADSIEVSDDDAAAKYDEDPTAFDTVSYYMISKSASEFAEQNEDGTTAEVGDTEKAAAKKAAEEVKKDFDTAEVTSTVNSKASITTNYGEDAANWLYDSARKEGNIELFASEDETTYYVFYFLGMDDHDYSTANYQAITISADTQAEDSDAAMEAAFATYEEIKGQINADNFAQIAENYGLAVTPAENASKDNLTEAVQSWMFDKNRKEGDIEGFNVGTAYTIYLYEGKGDNCRTLLVKNSITNELLSAWEEDHSHTNEVELHADKFDCLKTDLVINKVFSAS